MAIGMGLAVEFHLEGKTPFLFHADDVFAADDLAEWRQRPENKNVSKPGDDRSPPWTWQSYLYHDGETLALPAENLMACLRRAGGQVIMKRQKTFKESTQSGLFAEAEFFPMLIAGQPVERQPLCACADEVFAEQVRHAERFGLRLYTKRARVGQSKHVRVRPRADVWSVSGKLEVFAYAPELTFDVLQTIFQIAGRVGLGDWRPGCPTPGRFGMFEAMLKEV